MNGFRLISAIARGTWLIDENFVYDNKALISRVLDGQQFGSTSVEEYGNLVADPSFRSYNPRNGWSDVPENTIAVHYLIGPIMHYGVCGPGTSELHAQFLAADNNNNIIGHLFILDTPGGQADGIKEYADAIKASKKAKNGYIKSGMSASGGVWIMSALDKVFASSDLVAVGSIGAYLTLLDFTEKDKKDGIKETIIRARQSVDKNLIYEKANAGDKEAIEKLRDGVSFLAGHFIDFVQEGRGDRLTSDDWKTGKMYSAPEAVDLGLIDGIAPMEEVTAMYFLPPNTEKNKTNNMSKFTNVAALAGNDSVSQEQLDLANADLTAAGIIGHTIVEQSVIDEGARVTEELAAANTALTAANTAIANQVTEIANLQSKVTTLEGVIAKRAVGDNGSATKTDATLDSEIQAGVEQPKLAAHNKAADTVFFGV